MSSSSSSTDRAGISPSGRLDAPSLALAIRRRDVRAVRSMLEQGAPLDVSVWGCKDAIEMAELMLIDIRDTWFGDRVESHGNAEKILSMLKAARGAPVLPVA